MRTPAPVDVRPLFAPLGVELASLLRGLDAAAWTRPATPRWTVHDVAAHLLDTGLRRLAIQRDGHWPPPPDPAPDDYASLVGFLNGLNADWARVATRFSPRVLTELLEIVDRAGAAFLETVALDAPALFPVDWAGVDGAAMWLDLGREYTERWHHQQQIRDAAGARALDDARWIRPVLAIAARALPRAWRTVAAAEGTVVEVRLASAVFCLRREGSAWTLLEGAADRADARVETDDETAWRAWHQLRARDTRLTLSGDPRLTEPFLTARALMV